MRNLIRQFRASKNLLLLSIFSNSLLYNPTFYYLNLFFTLCGLIAQSVEQKTENLRVGGSIPPQATILDS